MKHLSLILIMLGFSTASFAAKVELEGRLMLMEPRKDGLPIVKTLFEVTIQDGNFEANSREGFPNYRGVPWNLITYLNEDGEVQIIFWIDNTDFHFDSSDSAKINKSFDATLLEAQSISLLNFADGAELRLTLIPSPVAPKLSEIPLTARALGLNFLCLKNSSVVVDDNYYMGSVTGFGEKLIIGLPGLAKVHMSFQPKNNWTPIGTYDNGVIEVPLEAGHQVAVLSVGIGPDGISQGGPFTIFGFIEAPRVTVDEARKILDEQMSQHFSGERLTVLQTATKGNPYGHLGQVTVGNFSHTSDQLKRRAGSFGDRLTECSS